MSRNRGVVLGLALGLLLAAAPARADQTARWWVVPGGQMTWPSHDLGLERRDVGPGGIIGYRLNPNWALEGRLHYTELEAAKGVVGPGTQLTHYEGDLTYFLDPAARFSPYLTGGIGGAHFTDALDGKEWVFNGGVGFLYHFNPTVALRVDGRHLAHRHPVTSDDRWLATHEVFAGLSFGFGGTKVARAPARDGDEDGDGVTDRNDRCPHTPRGARVDADGCPKDSDGDGVWDGIDECPNTPKGCDVDSRGCEKDGDHDGVCDGMDRCPNTPAGDKVDKYGCTVTAREKELIETGMIRLDNVYFDTAKSTIKHESHAVLDEVADILNKYDDLKIEIGGHTDSRGKEAYNERLSQDRANAVLDYLMTRHDFSRSRFSTKGYGESKPIASNDTQAGMAKNRRVEFKVLNPEALKR